MDYRIVYTRKRGTETLIEKYDLCSFRSVYQAETHLRKHHQVHEVLQIIEYAEYFRFRFSWMARIHATLRRQRFFWTVGIVRLGMIAMSLALFAVFIYIFTRVL